MVDLSNVLPAAQIDREASHHQKRAHARSKHRVDTVLTKLQSRIQRETITIQAGTCPTSQRGCPWEQSHEAGIEQSARVISGNPCTVEAQFESSYLYGETRHDVMEHPDRRSHAHQLYPFVRLRWLYHRRQLHQQNHLPHLSPSRGPIAAINNDHQRKTREREKSIERISDRACHNARSSRKSSESGPSTGLKGKIQGASHAFKASPSEPSAVKTSPRDFAGLHYSVMGTLGPSGWWPDLDPLWVLNSLQEFRLDFCYCAVSRFAIEEPTFSSAIKAHCLLPSPFRIRLLPALSPPLPSAYR